MKIPVSLRRLSRFAVTLCAALVAVLLATALWRHYMISPWTRDGRVRAETVTLAPEVSGPVVELRVVDNQVVHKGDVLFVVDPRNYQNAVDQAKAALDGQTHALRIARLKAESRAKLTDLAISSEERATFQTTADVSSAAVEAARAKLDLANLNLERATIRSPVNGSVTNLRLRLGDYVKEGQTALAIVDSDSYWVAGYFEETQLAAIHPGDQADYVLMGYPGVTLHGHVDSISRGIADQNADGSGVTLASVNPVFTWVRLAQRIPVRVAIEKVPSDMALAAGMTTTVMVGKPTTLAEDLDWAYRFWMQGGRM
jgi:multidrug resistance efflux pump